jgi:aspartate kinase
VIAAIVFCSTYSYKASIVVVSAMGHTTDNLLKLSKEITSNPSAREMDMLLSTGEQI